MSKASVSRTERAFAHRSKGIPGVFCWTKMGTEAGQPLNAILHRKELERLAGNGVFAWGIGNSLGAAPALAQQMTGDCGVDVLFTPMKSAAKQVDVAPSQILLWLSFLDTLNGPSDLPAHVMITSRGGPEKRAHYALLCRSDIALDQQDPAMAFDATDVRNLVSDNPIGASQVTSVVRYYGEPNDASKTYRVAMHAKLHAEGFVRLTNPVMLRGPLLSLYQEICDAKTAADYRAGITELKQEARRHVRTQSAQHTLFSL